MRDQRAAGTLHDVHHDDNDDAVERGARVSD
jgi:hypothetical protein